MSVGNMTEDTLQFAIKVFSICVAVIVVGIVGTFCYLVIRDGNNVLVSEAFGHLSDIVGQAFLAITTIVVGKPIASGMLQFLQGKGVQASTTNVAATPNGTAIQSTPAASQAPSAL